MKGALIKAIVKVSYVEKNWVDKIKSITADIDKLPTLEEKSSYFYNFFAGKIASKADFAQQFAFELEETFTGKLEELNEALPSYLVEYHHQHVGKYLHSDAVLYFLHQPMMFQNL